MDRMSDPPDNADRDPQEERDLLGSDGSEPMETVYLSSSKRNLADNEGPKEGKKKESAKNEARKARKKKAEDPRIGTSLGEYQVVGVLGRGGMGVVYQAYDPIIDRMVAIKLLPQDVADEDEEAFRRLLLEAQTAGRLNHQNTVAVYDAGLEGDTYYVVLELMTGGNVLERLVKKRYTWIKATKVIAEACRGVAAAMRIETSRLPHRHLFTRRHRLHAADRRTSI